MQTTTIERVQRPWGPNHEYFRRFLKSLRDDLETVCDDIWLETMEAVEYLYAVDFQELHNVMYPFWSEDQTLSDDRKRQVRADDILASEVMKSTDKKFVLLDGTYMELCDHIVVLGKRVGIVKGLQLQSAPLQALNRFLLEIASKVRQDEISLSTSMESTSRKAAQVLAQYEEAFQQLVVFLETKVTSLGPLLKKNKKKDFTIKLSRYEAAYGDLRSLRSAPDDVRRNEADALNLAAIISLNDYFKDSFERGVFNKRYVVRLFTHTPTIFKVGDRPSDFSIDLRYSVGGRITPLLATPGFIYLDDLCRRKEKTWGCFEDLVDLRSQLGSAVDSFDTLTWHLIENRRPFSELRDGLLREVREESPETWGSSPKHLEAQVDTIGKAIEHPVVKEVATQYLRLSPIGMPEEPAQLPERSVSIPTLQLISSANHICNQLETVRYLLQLRNPGAAARMQRLPVQDISLASAAREGLFVAENLGYVREKSGVFNKTFNCIEHRLRTMSGELVLAIDLYHDFYVVSWPTRCAIMEFAELVSKLLRDTSYEIGKKQLDPEVEGIAVMEPSGRIEFGPLVLPIAQSPILLGSIKPILLRINAKQAAYCCETATPVGTPLTGLIGTPDTVDYIEFLYQPTNGLLPEATLKIEVARIGRHFGAKA